MQKARDRFQEDLKRYSKEQIAEAEALYQVANKNWLSDAARANLTTLVEKYPSLNRTGCAVLYLAQMTTDPSEREKLFKQAIDKHADSFYGDGVQVGAYARFLLATHYREAGRAAEAHKIFDQIVKSYPDSIDHSGKSLVAQIPK